MKARMSFADNTTTELWRRFMPLWKRMANDVDTDLFSIEIYPQGFFEAFNPENTFEKWAAVPVNNGVALEGMELCDIPQGRYAVFTHYGPASEGVRTYTHIFNEWLPQSGFTVDTRPHFAVMGAKYDANSPSSEEEIWIPITTDH